VANELYESGRVNYAYPNWIRKRFKRATPNDTFFLNQWHLNNTGQSGGAPGEDVNIVSVWDTYRGSADEVIAVVDDGLEITHEDLEANVNQVVNWDFASVPQDSDPSPVRPDDNHGTNVAGVAAGVGFNGLGISGAAPNAGLVGLRLLGLSQSDAKEAKALSHERDVIDIYSNSWGPDDGGSVLDGPGPATEDALEKGAADGRGKLGNIYVWAAGNGGSSDNSNYDGYANSRYTIAVSASTNTGDEPSYAEKGANILVNAPSSGGTLGITTTDRTGGEGSDSSNYYHDFGGTSAAAPLVSGIIALMLEANPSLTWRDVQHILMVTAEKNDPSDPDWTTNGAGFHVNPKFGFGRVNAQAAVAAADLKFPSDGYASPAAGPVQGDSTPALAIPDNNIVGVSDTITIPDDILVEFVEIFFTSNHPRWGDLEITLTSPAGTESVLGEKHDNTEENVVVYSNWRFGSVRHFGESSQGDWTLTVKDLRSGITGVFESWTLEIYGFTERLPWVERFAPGDGGGGGGGGGGCFISTLDSIR